MIIINKYLILLIILNLAAIVASSITGFTCNKKIEDMQQFYDLTNQTVNELAKNMNINEKRIDELAKENTSSLLTLQTEVDTIVSDMQVKEQNVILSTSQSESKIEEELNTLNAVDTDKWSVNEEVPLPNIPTNVKFCTDYRCYNIEGTPHLKMQNLSYTDELGCRRFNDDYCVALGSFYSERIGDRFEVTLDSGRIFTVITGDMKADCDTDPNNMYGPCINYDFEPSANVLEFIIDDTVVSDDMYNYGSLDYHEEFKGNIVRMIYLGRDNSTDWDKYE